MTPFRTFIGDEEKDLLLTPQLIVELESKTSTGIAALFRRVAQGAFQFLDLQESIRLGLVGGGSSPAEAAAIVKTYVAERPIAEILPAALGVLSLAWFGPNNEEAGE